MTSDANIVPCTFSVLVATSSPLLALAILRRLLNRPWITIAKPEMLLFGRSRFPCDVLVLCPYLTATERHGITRRLTAQLGAPRAIVELGDPPAGRLVRVGDTADELATTELESLFGELGLAFPPSASAEQPTPR